MIMRIEEVVANYGTYIYKYALKLTCNPVKAEDIAQETFIHAWENMEQLREEEAIKKWLRSICYRQFLMDYRKTTKHNLELHDKLEELELEGSLLGTQLPNPEEEVVVEESIRSIQSGCFYAMASKLSLHQRIAFSLIDMFGLSVSEVSQMLQLSNAATKGLLFRARKNLDAFFDGHCNLLDVKNPCRCQAWIDFRSTNENNKKAARKIITSLEDCEREYQPNDLVRKKIYYLYRNMPDQQPDATWFHSIIESLK